jgi:hypothetical protein
MTIGRGRRVSVAVLAVLPLAVAALVTVACAATTTHRPGPPASSAGLTAREIIASLKAYEARVGFAPTGNFTAATADAFPGRCYYTGTLELPESYQGLQVIPAVNGGCPLDDSQFDVFPYALETAATGSSAITPALEGATLERLLMVVPHEDFHNQPEAQRAPPPLAEAAATLAGFVTAAGFARERFGPDAAIVQHLADEAALFERKAEIVNGYYDELAVLYAAYRESRVRLDEALERKRILFRELGRACLESGPAPVSFNRCPAVLNNAGLAFDRTYTREYQPLFELAGHQARNVAAIVKALRDTLARGRPPATMRLGSHEAQDPDARRSGEPDDH